MKYFILSVLCCYLSYGQTNEIVFTTISFPEQEDLYPEGYWDVWVNDLPSTEEVIKNASTSRRVRQMEYFNRFLVYAKMQTNTSEDLLSVFMDSYTYAPHYTAYRYTDVIPLKGKEYKYMWNMYDKEKPIIDSMCNALRSTYDSKLVDKIQDIKEKDQRYRQLLSTSTLDKLKADGSWQKQLALDKENSESVKAILESVGYPGRSIVGYENESAAFLAIQHSNLELMEYGLPYLKKAAKDLDLDVRYYPYLYDRIQLLKKLPQRFGTQSNLDGTLYELSDPETVNIRRQEYGLFPIKL